MRKKTVTEPPKKKVSQADISVGDRIRHLTIIEEIHLQTKFGIKVFYRCLCDCGKECVRQRASFLRGRVSSCGCQKHFTCKTHGMTKTRTYNIYHAMMQRCYDKNQHAYKRYGGAGITVCDRWIESFENFLNDMGECPSSKHSIDRIDSRGNYEPQNCRWVTSDIQSRNRNVTIKIPYKGEMRCVVDVANEIGMKYTTLYMRIYQYGWSIEKAILTPINKSHWKKQKHE